MNVQTTGMLQYLEVKKTNFHPDNQKTPAECFKPPISLMESYIPIGHTVTPETWVQYGFYG
jgi:hypothetical protein